MVLKLNVAIIYASFSGNTQEVAELVAEELRNQGHSAELWRIGAAVPQQLTSYDVVILGTFTWNNGAIPDIFGDFIDSTEARAKKVFVFGTGDTQFPYYCGAADQVHELFSADGDVLKIEQSPRDSQELKITEWTKGVLRIVAED
ncbi:flavodoxin [Peribacillus huizhouensis]|uniref:Ribonucleotide reductase-associated flavodoxin n=1 Tax=Peribacillus huizhouensis TaxID=1501239 RepID=A0ABR6CR95_9BACI|nr:flavodoxin [Peribacillus huizhouensis]MBA9027554.1 putative ribonucleotide reductase-associated flavodoxin [Peribacillus huizhouensis]